MEELKHKCCPEASKDLKPPDGYNADWSMRVLPNLYMAEETNLRFPRYCMYCGVDLRKRPTLFERKEDES